MCRPAVIEYKDFTVDHVYRKRFTITNVSLSFNRFKVSPLGQARHAYARPHPSRTVDRNRSSHPFTTTPPRVRRLAPYRGW